MACSLVAIQAAQLQAQSTPTSKKSLDEAIHREFGQLGMPGCAYGVIQEGKLIVSGAYGLADVENGVSINASTRFDIGSMSKQFLALAVLMLAKGGKLALDDDVHKYVPELPNYQWKIALRDLMHHMSGLKDYDQLLQLAGWRDGDLKSVNDVLWIAQRQRSLAFEPGTQYMYSDTNYFLLGLIAQRVTGKRIDDVLREMVFTPLGMTHTSLRTDRWSLVPHKAWPYAIVGGKPRLFVNAEEPLGDGGIFTTVGDLALWEANFDHPIVGDSQIIAEMRRTFPLRDGTPNEYAAGLYIRSYRGRPMIEHSGTSYGYQAEKMHFPEQRLSVITLCNRRDGSYVTLSNRLTDAFLPSTPSIDKSEEPSPKVGSSKEQLAALAGFYFSESAADGVLIEVRDGAVVDNGREYHQTGRFTFVSSSEGTLCRCPTTYTFRVGPNGDIEGLVSSRPIRNGVGAETSTSVFFKKMTVPQTQPSLADYVGDYVSDDLATSWCLYQRERGLFLRRRGFADRRLELLWQDAAEAPGGILQFERNGTQVSGFQLRNIRVNSVFFRKLPFGMHSVPMPYSCP